jgi:hypothetical protein
MRHLIGIGAILLCLSVLMPIQTVIASPGISVTPGAGARGTEVTVFGSNFVSYAGDLLSLYIDMEEVVGSQTLVPSTGIFKVSFRIPVYAGPGDVTISIRSNTGAVLSETSFTVITPEVRLNTWGGTVGTAVTASCKGFYVGEPVTFHYKFDGEWDTLGTQNASDTGECSMSFLIPSSPEGKHPVMVDNARGHSATAEFDVIPAISIDPSTAAVGDKVAVIGTGFAAGGEVVVTLHGNRVAYANTHERGSFTALFIVPVLKAGTYVLDVDGANRVRRWGELTLVTRITLGKNSGDVGDKLTVNGSGFEAGGDVIIKYDSQDVLVITADEAGAFSINFSVPVSSAGSHVVTATDGVITQQMIFAVESEAPPAPNPLTPKNQETAALPLALDWEGIYDPSQPVVYSIQIARTDDFQRPVFEKTGITVTQYTLVHGESLPPNRRWNYYYWRVRATDGASNIGEWSIPASFRVKPTDILPAWSRYLLVAGQLLIVITLAFLLRKALSSKDKNKPEG